jgi:hypothetical protein
MDKIVLSQTTQLELEIRTASAGLVEALENLNESRRARDEAKRVFDEAASESLSQMTKADGAEDQRKAKVRSLHAMKYADLWAAETTLHTAETALQIAQEERSMLKDILVLWGGALR